jgi:hypothetical protein
MIRFGIILIGIAILLSCKSKQSTHKSLSSPQLLSATKELWSAGHRSGGRGVEFEILLKIELKNEYMWQELTSSDRSLEIRKVSISGDTCILKTGWLSNTDEKYASEGVPAFTQAQLKFQQNGKPVILDIPEFNTITSKPRP